MMARFIHDPPYLKLKRNAGVDLWGIGLLALGLGSLQILLDTGQRKDWLGSRDIRIEAFLCIVGLAVFVIRELTVAHPIVDLRSLKDRSLPSASASCRRRILPLRQPCPIAAVPPDLAQLPVHEGRARTLPARSRFPAAYLYRRSHCRPRRCPQATRRRLRRGSHHHVHALRPHLNAGYWDIFWPRSCRAEPWPACSFLSPPPPCPTSRGEDGQRHQHLQPHAQHRRQRRNRRHDHPARPPPAVPPEPPCRTHPPGQPYSSTLLHSSPDSSSSRALIPQPPPAAPSARSTAWCSSRLPCSPLSRPSKSWASSSSS